MPPSILEGPLRSPVNMLTEQTYAGHKSLHDDAEAARLGIRAGPIEGPTHFQQFVPLLAGVWGQEWFERGCFSCHFLNMVFDGEKVRAQIDRPADGARRTLARAFKEDGTQILEASASLGPDHGETLLEARMKALRPAGELIILSDLRVGMAGARDEEVIMGPDQHMGALYPFSLADKLAVITEDDPSYHDCAASPWGAAIIPLEMISVLGNYTSHIAGFPVRQPSIGLFAGLEIRMIEGPLRVGEPYLLRREIVALSQSPRVENYWVRTRFFDQSGHRQLAEMLLNHGVLKASYPGYA